MAENTRPVPIGGIVVSDVDGDVLVAYGLGSCVAVCLYDPVARVGGMLHALLPAAPNGNTQQESPAKFVDQGVPLLINALVQSGARRTRLVAGLCGGANMLSASGLNGRLNIGERNVEAAKVALRAARLSVRAQATGGNAGRTVRFNIADGQITVRSLGRSQQVMGNSVQ